MRGLVAVAMSGGVDSSVAAWLLAQREPSVVGVSMLLWDRSEEARNGRCCGALDLGDARRGARQIGIPHYTLRMDREFREKVVDPFVDDYLHGRTPIPCVQCNTWIKFDRLLERARTFGAERVATGHYARILDGSDGPELHRAVAEDKDQSYYLFELTQQQLAASLFPLGEMTKAEVREVARRAGLGVADKGESMEICFVARDLRTFVEEQVAERPERFSSGRRVGPSQIVDESGRELGRGAPYFRYTVGQRRGLGVATGERLYVLAVEPRANRVVVGPGERLLAPGLLGERLHWIGPQPSREVAATVKIRARHRGVPAVIHPLEVRRVAIEFTEPQRGVTPGQAAVFYQGSRVLGGCWISSPLPRGRARTPLSETVVG